MSSNRRHQSIPFWDWIQSFDPNQGPARGVDNNNALFMDSFPFGGPGFGGPGGHRGPHPPPHHGHPHHPHHPPGPHPPPPPPPGAENLDWGTWFHTGPYRGPQDHQAPHRAESVSEAGPPTPTTEQDKSETVTADVPDPEEVAPEENQCGSRPQGVGRGRGRGRGGRGRRGGCGSRPGSGHHHGPESHPPPYPGPGFDLSSMFRGMASHPFFRNMQHPAQTAKGDSDSDSNSFTPPVDIFSTQKTFVLHVALPGAKKEDVGVNWDPEHGLLKISGVVHRPGDEAFLQTLTRSERTVGVFERNVPLPPDGNEEVDGFGITAKMEDGVLVITVPKVEKEWTEIHKVDIE